MPQASVNIRMDANLKKEFDLFCDKIGLSTSAAINIFAKTVVRQQRIPFELSLEIPNEETMAAIKEVENMKKYPERYKAYKNVDEMFKDILKWPILLKRPENLKKI